MYNFSLFSHGLSRSVPWIWEWWYLLTVSRKRINLPGKKTKKLTTHLILALMCFLSFQANLILVPFPAHRQQVSSIYHVIVLWTSLERITGNIIAKLRSEKLVRGYWGTVLSYWLERLFTLVTAWFVKLEDRSLGRLSIKIQPLAN